MKSIIIVCDEKRKKFGDFLAQLISKEDDTEEGAVGVKDGCVETQVWTEKEYNCNSPTISSDQHLLFIGNSKDLKEKREFMNVEFSEYGMKYGSLGKQAFITVEEVVKDKDYKEFKSFAQGYAEKLGKDITEKKALKRNGKVGESALEIIPLALLGPFSTIPIIVNKTKEKKDQMYCCAVMKFYLDFLSEVLGF